MSGVDFKSDEKEKSKENKIQSAACPFRLIKLALLSSPRH
jgi:hypothetical protein